MRCSMIVFLFKLLLIWWYLLSDTFLHSPSVHASSSDQSDPCPRHSALSVRIIPRLYKVLHNDQKKYSNNLYWREMRIFCTHTTLSITYQTGWMRISSSYSAGISSSRSSICLDSFYSLRPPEFHRVTLHRKLFEFQKIPVSPNNICQNQWNRKCFKIRHINIRKLCQCIQYSTCFPNNHCKGLYICLICNVCPLYISLTCNVSSLYIPLTCNVGPLYIHLLRTDG